MDGSCRKLKIHIVLGLTPDEVVDEKADYVPGSLCGKQPLPLAVFIGVAAHGKHPHPVVEEKADYDHGSPCVRQPLPIVLVIGIHAVDGKHFHPHRGVPVVRTGVDAVLREVFIYECVLFNSAHLSCKLFH